MKYADNIRELSSLPIDYMGFIFYAKSPRYAGEMDPSIVNLPRSILKTGVFVDEPVDNMIACSDRYGLDAVQLHGRETPGTCRFMRSRNVEVIKTFSIERAEDFAQCASWAEDCDYFLFDTKTPQHGGSGRQFDWDVLEHYRDGIPFFLSGGIGADSAERLRSFHHPSCCGIDLNSRFERQPGWKDIALLKQFLERVKQ
jgi:phosphoribosylanthranilate isomerase